MRQPHGLTIFTLDLFDRYISGLQILQCILNGPFVYGGTNCTRGWTFADIFFSDSVKIMRFYDFARTSVS